MTHAINKMLPFSHSQEIVKSNCQTLIQNHTHAKSNTITHLNVSFDQIAAVTCIGHNKYLTQE